MTLFNLNGIELNEKLFYVTINCQYAVVSKLLFFNLFNWFMFKNHDFILSILSERNVLDHVVVIMFLDS